MPTDWENFTPNRIPKNSTNVENVEVSVPPDTSVSGGAIDAVSIGPKQVFKTGYPTGKSVGAEGSIHTGRTEMARITLTASDQVDILDAHGVADASQVQSILHPEDKSLLDSIASQEAFLVTKDFKLVDIAASTWPINLESVPDLRSVLQATVQCGEELGIVVGHMDDSVLVKTATGNIIASVHDLNPVMADTSHRVDKRLEDKTPEELQMLVDVWNERLSTMKPENPSYDLMARRIKEAQAVLMHKQKHAMPIVQPTVPENPEAILPAPIIAASVQVRADTTPNEDIAKVFEAMGEKGVIKIQLMDEAGKPFYRGVTPEDQGRLKDILGTGSGDFWADAYDAVLGEVSNAGYSLEQDLLEEEK